VTGYATKDQEVTQRNVAFGVTGEPFSSWAGPVSIATGVEWRREGVVGTADPISRQNGFLTGNWAAVKGHYNVGEVYLETLVPLAKALPWVAGLDLNAAVRATDYSLAGNVTTWRVGLDYRMTDELRFRATRSRDIRAPNLDELFGLIGG